MNEIYFFWLVMTSIMIDSTLEVWGVPRAEKIRL